MELDTRPVDVICLCDAEGTIRPLRLRMEIEDREWVRVDIEEILDSKSSNCYGAESMWFLCRTRISGRARVVEIKYSVRNHCWSILYRKK